MNCQGRLVDERGNRAEDYRDVAAARRVLAAALDGFDGGMNSGEWQNPEVLAALSTSAQRVTVGERQRASADLRLIRWAR